MYYVCIVFIYISCLAVPFQLKVEKFFTLEKEDKEEFCPKFQRISTMFPTTFQLDVFHLPEI